jgi:hypothetical protein
MLEAFHFEEADAPGSFFARDTSKKKKNEVRIFV